MPHRSTLPSPANDDAAARVHEVGAEDAPASPKRLRRSSLMRNIGSLWKRHVDPRDVETALPQAATVELPPLHENSRARRSSLPGTCRRAMPSLPRPQTFRRQESERREKLLEVPPSPTERRAVSADCRHGYSLTRCIRTLSPQPLDLTATSVQNITTKDEESKPVSADAQSSKSCATETKQSQELPKLPPLQIPQREDFDIELASTADDEVDLALLQEEFERRWILNLSMHFRDQSRREKFFVTYAETPSKWRRLTISLDYRDVHEGSGSLEADLSTMHYQRDKSFRIYEAIHESLPEIQYYNTVTNLRLETTPEDGQLHVHVREDANEIVQFPSVDLFAHVQAPKVRESDVEFLTHLSGFVYKVRACDKVVIKKEIPGPDTIDEFLYEVNALDALQQSRNVVGLEGLVTDDSGLVVKGLLISFASHGALVDVLYDHRETSELPWHRREKWAKQIVQGLSDIHEAGFVQGDFTLSNIVIDGNDNALIIDINRRGCPVGWEPPELSRLIDSGQRISMCIGVKTDIYQLGMVLWGIAEVVDEPERVERPLPRIDANIPSYFQVIVDSCLSTRPQARQSAKKLLRQFPITAGRTPSSARSVDFAPDMIGNDDVRFSDQSLSTSHRSDKEYIDPDMAVTLEDVSTRHRHRRPHSPTPDVTSLMSEHVTYFSPSREDLTDAASNPASTNAQALSNPTSTSYRFESSGSWIVGQRGRAREYGYSGIRTGRGRRRSSPYARSISSNSSATSVSGARSPPSRSRRRGGSVMSEEAAKGLQSQEPEAVKEVARDVCDVDKETAEPSAPVALDESDTAPRENAAESFWDFTFVSDAPPHQEFVHTDSGFDEEMTTQFADLTTGTVAQFDKVEECPIKSVELPPEPETPVTHPEVDSKTLIAETTLMSPSPTTNPTPKSCNAIAPENKNPSAEARRQSPDEQQTPTPGKAG